MAAAAASPPVPLGPDASDLLDGDLRLKPAVAISWDSEGKNNELPIVEPFGSFTMDLFTPQSDLDLSVNFNTDANDQYPRKNKISAIRKLAHVLFSHQRNYCSKHISHLS
ncbi:Nucleotidyltransferase family protein [Zea mays]|uniref:Nucleotidyltransferase family protein n=1 Tax=Zea mays TaxID=4577 RepID=A0A1D6PYR7_MAIZE|nr:Nucleotidyltransferase family protein [Zea mays]